MSNPGTSSISANARAMRRGVSAVASRDRSTPSAVRKEAAACSAACRSGGGCRYEMRGRIGVTSRSLLSESKVYARAGRFAMSNNSSFRKAAMDRAAQAAGIGALADPVRRALYEYVAAQPDAVGREAAAAAVRVPVHTAKFHLDRLCDEGLLQTEFRRLSGRTGPGAGRPAKLYRRASRQFAISLPE